MSRKEQSQFSSAHTDLESGETASSAQANASASEQDQDAVRYSAFRPGIKIMLVALAAASGFMSPFSSTMYVPALDSISKELHITKSDTLLSVALYLLLQGVSPSFWGPLSDKLGRRPILISTFTVLLGANLGLSFAKTFTQLLILRMLQAFGASSAIAIGAGIIGDISQKKERGKYMSYFQSGALVGPCVAPVVGGLVSHRWDWHANFFFLSVFGGILILLMILFLPETLRSLVEDGSRTPRGIWKPVVPLKLTFEDQNKPNSPVMHKIPSLDIRTLGFEKPWLVYTQWDVVLLIASYSIPFSVFSTTSSTLSQTLASQYGYNNIIIGLCYLPLGVGFALGSVLAGYVVDGKYARAKSKDGVDMNLFKARLSQGPIFNVLFCGGVIAFEWCLDKSVHIAVPMVVVFFAMAFSMLYFTAM